MRSLRTPETTMFGYVIERIEDRDDLGLTDALCFEVLSPASGAVLASFPSRRDAECFVLRRELRNPVEVETVPH